MSETKNLIKKVGIGLITINVLWLGLIPVYIKRDLDFYFDFYNYKYKFSLTNILPWFQGIITLSIIYNIKNA